MSELSLLTSQLKEIVERFHRQEEACVNTCAVLRAKLEANALREELQRMRGVVAQYQRELKESNQLLIKQRLPPRPYTNSTEKQLIAASQGWKCAGEEDCPLKVLNSSGEPFFDQSLFIIDHEVPYSASGKHLGNRRAICCWCDAVKTRREIADRKHRRPEGEESGED